MKLVHDLTGDDGEESPRWPPLTVSSSKLKSFWLSQQSAWKLYILNQLVINNPDRLIKKNCNLFFLDMETISLIFSNKMHDKPRYYRRMSINYS